MSLAICGNIVTAWSWFGTNLLGVGLHSYGFTDSGFRWMALFVLSQIALILLAHLPYKFWCSAFGRDKHLQQRKRILLAAEGGAQDDGSAVWRTCCSSAPTVRSQNNNPHARYAQDAKTPRSMKTSR